MLNPKELETLLKSRAEGFGWDLSKGEATKMITLLVDVLRYIIEKNEVTVSTPQGPGTGKAS